MSNDVRRVFTLTSGCPLLLVALANGLVGCGPDELLLGVKESSEEHGSKTGPGGLSDAGDALPQDAGPAFPSGTEPEDVPTDDSLSDEPFTFGDAGTAAGSVAALDPTGSSSDGASAPTTTGTGSPVPAPTTMGLPDPSEPVRPMTNGPGINPTQSVRPPMSEPPSADAPSLAPFPSVDEVELDESRLSQDVASCTLLEAEIEQRVAQSQQSISLPLLTGRWTPTPGSDPMLLDLRDDGTGTFTFGEPTTFPPVEDPAAAYLVDVAGEEELGSFLATNPLSGFTYQVRVVRGAGSGGTLEYFPTEPWQTWCQLQPPQRGDYCYACDFVLGGGLRTTDDSGKEVCAVQGPAVQGASVAIDCARWGLCGSDSVCECTSATCDLNRSQPVTVTIAVDPLDTSVLQVSTLNWPTNYLVREAPAEP